MLQKITPALKGLITGLLMVAVALVIDYTKQPANTKLQYIAYALYAGGILWTLFSYVRSISHAPGFSELFGQGFRCFVIVTLIMVAFTFIYIKMHPELAEEEAIYQRKELVKQKDKTPEQINEIVAGGKKGFIIKYVSASIFGYLIIGSVLTAACSGIIILRRNA
jgi:hypothetical protein